MVDVLFGLVGLEDECEYDKIVILDEMDDIIVVCVS